MQVRYRVPVRSVTAALHDYAAYWHRLRRGFCDQLVSQRSILPTLIVLPFAARALPDLAEMGCCSVALPHGDAVYVARAAIEAVGFCGIVAKTLRGEAIVRVDALVCHVLVGISIATHFGRALGEKSDLR